MRLEQILGIEDSDIVTFENDHAMVSKHFRIHQAIIPQLELLCEKAWKDGIKLALISGYRSYQRQVTIWDEKYRGERDILDQDSHPIKEFNNDEEKFCAISQWSAIPGASRHHWGTDIDVFDATSLENGYQLKLIPEEFSGNGPCEKLNHWLNQNLSSYGFIRPYFSSTENHMDSTTNRDLSRKSTTLKPISIEPWHISYLPLAQDYIQYITAEKLINTWSRFPFSASDWAKNNVQAICKLLGT